MPNSGAKLFQPIRVGNCELSHRVVLAPLTRYCADEAHVPTDLMVEYYAQRTCIPGTLAVTEATFIGPKAGGYDNVPGIWSDEQVIAWKKVTPSMLVRSSAEGIHPCFHIGRRCGSCARLLHFYAALATRANGHARYSRFA